MKIISKKKRVKKLPKNPKEGNVYKRKVKSPRQRNPRDVSFKATGKKGFGKYKIIKNEPYKK